MTHIPLPCVQEVSMPRQERLIILCVCLAAFTFQFEAFVINVALPSMASELGVSSTEISFAVIVYLLATTIALVPAGKLGYRFGLRRTFLFGCALAAIATLV
jgi:MFS family permease